jgi:hypothetical protein
MKTLLLGVVDVLCNYDATAFLELFKDANGIFFVFLHLLLLCSTALLLFDLCRFLIEFPIKGSLVASNFCKD